MISSVRKITYLMSSKEKFTFVKLLLLIIFMSALDSIGIASIIPFFNLASDPNNISNNNFLTLIYEQFNFNSQDDFLIVCGLFTIATFGFASFIRFFTQIKIFKFAYFFEYGLAKRILNKTLINDYEYFLTKHSSEFGEKILSRVQELIGSIVLPMLMILTNIFLLIILFTFLLILDFKATVGIIILLSSFYLLFTFKFRNYLKSLGVKRLESHKRKFKIISELFGGIREIKIFNSENIFLNKYSKFAFNYANYQFYAKSISNVPKFGIEFLFVGAVIGIILIKVVYTKESFVEIISYLSVYTLAAYKLLPSIQQFFNLNIVLKYNLPLLNDLVDEYREIENKKINYKSIKKINIDNHIKFDNISYCYPESEINSLKDISIIFKLRKSVALVGSSGAGKTTLIEALTGLLKVKSGHILIDDKIVNNNNSNTWTHNFSVVPQTVYILDDTIAANIAFGIENNFISMDKVKFAAKIACLDQLIENKMPQKYLTRLGERGIKLSGGQRQRIAIARAIYKKSKFIIFDEATSELDSITEKQILSNMRNYLDGGIISVAHKLSTIKDFDEIVIVKDGTIFAKGNYDDLMNLDEFRLLNQNENS